MAATVARNVPAGRTEAVNVISAGLLRPGEPATDEAVKVMGRRGLNLSTHRSRRVGEASFRHQTLLSAWPGSTPVRWSM